MRRSRRFALVFAAMGLLIVMPAVKAIGDAAGLDIFRHGYPRFFQFRLSEGYAASGKYSYEDWARLFAPFDGIEGKVLEEEVPGRSVNVPYFTRFKREHPEKLVLLHCNGRARDPLYQCERFSAGHWLYYNGCANQSAIVATAGETEISVANPNLFRTNMGRDGKSNEDLAICALGPDGKPDWDRAEQVGLLAVDKTRKTIRVRRGCFGTRPLAFAAGRAWIAAHLTEGPWGKDSRLLWVYNFSLDCPRDRQGRNCADIHLAELAGLFSPQGALTGFDGLQFDVLYHVIGDPDANRARGVDADGDGRQDGGYVGDLNRYGLGVYDFLQRLRERLGDARLILADGMTARNQRGFDLLNGIESEGWPVLTDPEIEDWSGGLNRHFFWRRNARPPVLNYINHKFRINDERVDVPPGIARLVFAVAQFTDAAITYSDPPPAAPGAAGLPVWDELVKGVEQEQGWLGQPTGPPVRLAKTAPDLLRGAGLTMDASLVGKFVGEGVSFHKQGNELMVERTGGGGGDGLSFTLKGLKTDGPDLTVFVTLRAEPLAGYPPGVCRALWVGLPAEGGKEGKPNRFMTWMDGRPFEAAFYFRSLKTGTVDLEWEVEGTGRVWLSALAVHAAPDAIYREFAKGVVLANPSLHEFTYDLEKLLPGKRFRRLRGTPLQDPKANNGQPVEAEVTLGEREGLFLVRA